MARKKDNPTKGFYKRGNIWWFTYSRDGIQECRSTKSKTFTEAIKIKEKYLKQLNSNAVIIKQNNYLFDTVALKFLDEKERNLKPRTIELYKLILRNLINKFSETVMNDITKKDIKDYGNYRLLNGYSEGFLIK